MARDGFRGSSLPYKLVVVVSAKKDIEDWTEKQSKPIAYNHPIYFITPDIIIHVPSHLSSKPFFFLTLTLTLTPPHSLTQSRSINPYHPPYFPSPFSHITTNRYLSTHPLQCHSHYQIPEASRHRGSFTSSGTTQPSFNRVSENSKLLRVYNIENSKFDSRRAPKSP